MKRILILALAAGLSSEVVIAQDFHFSFPNISPIYYNPATIGLFRGDQYRFNLNHRRQWGQIAAPYQTQSFTADAHFFGDIEQRPFWGIGFGVISDWHGGKTFVHNHYDLGASYNVWLDKFNLVSAGIIAGMGQRFFSTMGMSWDNQFDGVSFNPSLAHGESFAAGTRWYPDFGSGIHWRYLNREETIRIQAGVGAYHLNEPDISITSGVDKLYSRIVAHVSSELSISDQKIVYAIPTVVHLRHGGNSFWYFGSDFKVHFRSQSQITDRKAESSASLGLYKRTMDGYALNVKLTHHGFTLGWTYDLITSDLRAAAGRKGAGEFTLTIIPTLHKVAQIYSPGWFL